MLRSLSQAKKKSMPFAKIGLALRYDQEHLHDYFFLLIVQIARLIPEIAKDL